MNTLKLKLTSSGALPAPPLPLPPRTSFFLRHNGQIRSTLDYFALNENNTGYRETCSNTIIQDGGKHLLALLSNADKNHPVNFFEGVYGGHVSMGALTFLEHQARMIYEKGGAFWPIFFCDEDCNAGIRNASDETHVRALSIFCAHLRPYCPGFVLGIESSEYWNRDQHNWFVKLIKYFAPDRYVAMHSQAVPDGGMPDVDAWFWEGPLPPSKGDEYLPEQLLAEVKKAAQYGKYIWPVEINWNRGERARAQNRLLLANGFGIGGPT